MPTEPATKRKTKFLGENHNTAVLRLKKNLLFKYVSQSKDSDCYRCGEPLTLDDFTVDHKEPWMYESVELFWDLDNVAFAHSKCNTKAARSISETSVARNLLIESIEE